MIVIVFTLCVSGTAECERHQIPAPGVNEMTCLTHAQAEISKVWRPGMTVARFGCERTE